MVATKDKMVVAVITVQNCKIAVSYYYKLLGSVLLPHKPLHSWTHYYNWTSWSNTPLHCSDVLDCFLTEQPLKEE